MFLKRGHTVFKVNYSKKTGGFKMENLNTLANGVVAELTRLGYSQKAIKTYRHSFDQVIAFASSKNETCYSESLGLDYLNEFFRYEDAVKNNSITMKETNALRVVRLLGDFQLHGTILRRRPRGKQLLKSEGYIALSKEFSAFCASQHHALATQDVYRNNADKFLAYLEAHGVTEVSAVSPAHIDGYLKTMIGYSYKSVETFLSGLRSFLRFLKLNGYHNADLSKAVPKLKARPQNNIPSVWKDEDVNKMIESIDRDNPMGKRAYAIILLVTRLGLRAVDVKNLKFDNIIWKENYIRLTQSKTSRALELPLLKDVGWAIIDYLKHGRPKTDSEYVFVTHKPPFMSFSEGYTFYYDMAKYMKAAGLPIKKDKKNGTHSLRHTLASTLLEKHTEITAISEILGHVSIESTSAYLKASINLLRECSLNPEGVLA
jgi:site-specific recombinase XerD